MHSSHNHWTPPQTYHDWSQDWPYWSQLNDAAELIARICRRYGRFGGQTKEKYGTLRFYCNFYSGGLHGLIKPGYYYSHWPKWLWQIDFHFQCSHSFLNKTLIQAIQWYQTKIYRLAYRLAAALYPMCYYEIYCDADYHELLSKDFDFSLYWTSPDDDKAA